MLIIKQMFPLVWEKWLNNRFEPLDNCLHNTHENLLICVAVHKQETETDLIKVCGTSYTYFKEYTGDRQFSICQIGHTCFGLPRY
jgi:hypothetical protein